MEYNKLTVSDFHVVYFDITFHRVKVCGAYSFTHSWIFSTASINTILKVVLILPPYAPKYETNRIWKMLMRTILVTV